MKKRDDDPAAPAPVITTAFLLSQIGTQSAQDYATRLLPLGLTPAHTGILRLVALSDGTSQRALGKRLGILPSRFVVLVDELEAKGLLTRDPDPTDRRAHALHLTEAAVLVLRQAQQISLDHDAALSESLSPEDREELNRLLTLLADHLGLSPGVHPGYKQIGRRSGPSGTSGTGHC